MAAWILRQGDCCVQKCFRIRKLIECSVVDLNINVGRDVEVIIQPRGKMNRCGLESASVYVGTEGKYLFGIGDRSVPL
jgi:hypothetical protein